MVFTGIAGITAGDGTIIKLTGHAPLSDFDIKLGHLTWILGCLTWMPHLGQQRTFAADVASCLLRP